MATEAQIRRLYDWCRQQWEARRKTIRERAKFKYPGPGLATRGELNGATLKLRDRVAPVFPKLLRYIPLPEIGSPGVSYAEFFGYLELVRDECVKSLDGQGQLQQEEAKAKQVGEATSKSPRKGRQPANLKNWAIGCEGDKWWVFQWLIQKKLWAQRGQCDLPEGRVTDLALELAQRGGALGKDEAVTLFRTDGYKKQSLERVFDSVCKPTRNKLAKCIREEIARVANTSVEDNPIPWIASEKCWRCEIEIGYAVKEEDGLVFKTRQQIDAENEYDR